MATQQLVPVTAKATTTATVTAPTSKDLYPKTTAPPLPEASVPPPKNMVPQVNDPEYRKSMALQVQGVCLKNMAHQAQETVFLKNMAHHQLEDYHKSMELRLLGV